MHIAISNSITSSSQMNGAAASGGGVETKFVMEVTVDALDLDFTINTGYNSGSASINFNVDWGDGDSDSGVIHDITHTFPGAGSYDVKIDGRFAMNNQQAGTSNSYKITKLKNWGNAECEFASVYRMFYKCKFMTYEATDIPDFSNLWPTSSGPYLAELFRGCESITNLDLTSWAPHLHGAKRFDGMFMMCYGLESVNITGWDFSAETTVAGIFRQVGTSTTNGCVVTAPNLNLPNVTLLDYIVYYSKLHADTDISGWTLGTGTQRWLYTFGNVSGDWAKNIDISDWTNKNPNSLQQTFWQASSSSTNVETINLTGMDTSAVTIFYSCFSNNTALTSITGLSSWVGTGIGGTSGNRGTAVMLSKCKVLNISPSAPAANQFPSAFWGQLGNQYTFQNWFVNFGVTTPYAPPAGFNNLDTSSGAYFTSMFSNAHFASNPDLSNIDMTNMVTTASAPQSRGLYGMFYLGGGITSVDASGWNMTSNNQSLRYFARSCDIETINFGSGTSTNDFSGVVSIQEMVRYSPVTSVEWPTNADFSSLTSATNFCSTADVPMTTAQYDNFLTRIDATNSNTGVTYSMGSCTYTGGGAVATARANIIAAGNTIIDGGIA